MCLAAPAAIDMGKPSAGLCSSAAQSAGPAVACAACAGGCCTRTRQGIRPCSQGRSQPGRARMRSSGCKSSLPDRHLPALMDSSSSASHLRCARSRSVCCGVPAGVSRARAGQGRGSARQHCQPSSCRARPSRLLAAPASRTCLVLHCSSASTPPAWPGSAELGGLGQQAAQQDPAHAGGRTWRGQPRWMSTGPEWPPQRSSSGWRGSCCPAAGHAGVCARSAPGALQAARRFGPGAHGRPVWRLGHTGRTLAEGRGCGSQPVQLAAAAVGAVNGPRARRPAVLCLTRAGAVWPVASTKRGEHPPGDGRARWGPVLRARSSCRGHQ